MDEGVEPRLQLGDFGALLQKPGLGVAQSGAQIGDCGIHGHLSVWRKRKLTPLVMVDLVRPGWTDPGTMIALQAALRRPMAVPVVQQRLRAR